MNPKDSLETSPDVVSQFLVMFIRNVDTRGNGITDDGHQEVDE